jgi:ATP phosphoribosyltransferase
MTEETINKLKFTIPKGSLWKVCSQLLSEAGYEVGDASRNYRPSINDDEIEIKLLRPQEIPEYLADGKFDLGISGRDWVKETNAEVEEVLDLEMGGVKIVFCIPTFWDNNIKTFDDFLAEFIKQDKTLRISTEYINIVINFIMQSKVYQDKFGDKKPWVYTPWQKWGDNEKVKIFLSFGATEAKPPEEVDCIFDNTSTGSTIRANNLRIVSTIDTSTALLLASPAAMKDPFKREKINDIKLLLNGVINGKKKFHVFMNCLEENVKKICEELPALKQPTISPLFGNPGWVAINTIIDKKDFLPLIPKLKKLAQGLVVIKPRQVINMLD